MVNLEKSEDAATIIAANTLRAHQDIAVLRFANVAHRLFVNGVQMRYEHDGSLSVDENEIVLTSSGVAFEFLAEAFEELLLGRAQKIFQVIHAETSQER